MAGRPAEPATIGFDIGGTRISGGLLSRAGALCAMERFERPVRTYAEALDAIASLHQRLQARAAQLNARVDGIGVAVAAFLTADGRSVRQSVKRGWRDVSLACDLAERLGRPVVVHNDSNAAAWGEYVYGAGRGMRCLLAVTIGTGLGSGVVYRGQLILGESGIAGEIGHLRVRADGWPCPCGGVGCLEQYASGPALERTAAILDERLRSMAGPEITAAAQRGHVSARKALGDVGESLGCGLAQAAILLDPSVIVVGGGLAAAGDLLLGPAREAFSRAMGTDSVRFPTPIAPSTLGYDAGVIGAAELARGSS